MHYYILPLYKLSIIKIFPKAASQVKKRHLEGFISPKHISKKMICQLEGWVPWKKTRSQRSVGWDPTHLIIAAHSPSKGIQLDMVWRKQLQFPIKGWFNKSNISMEHIIRTFQMCLVNLYYLKTFNKTINWCCAWCNLECFHFSIFLNLYVDKFRL